MKKGRIPKLNLTLYICSDFRNIYMNMFESTQRFVKPAYLREDQACKEMHQCFISLNLPLRIWQPVEIKALTDFYSCFIYRIFRLLSIAFFLESASGPTLQCIYYVRLFLRELCKSRWEWKESLDEQRNFPCSFCLIFKRKPFCVRTGWLEFRKCFDGGKNSIKYERGNWTKYAGWFRE